MERGEVVELCKVQDGFMVVHIRTCPMHLAAILAISFGQMSRTQRCGTEKQGGGTRLALSGRRSFGAGDRGMALVCIGVCRRLTTSS